MTQARRDEPAGPADRRRGELSAREGSTSSPCGRTPAVPAPHTVRAAATSAPSGQTAATRGARSTGRAPSAGRRPEQHEHSRPHLARPLGLRQQPEHRTHQPPPQARRTDRPRPSLPPQVGFMPTQPESNDHVRKAHTVLRERGLQEVRQCIRYQQRARRKPLSRPSRHGEGDPLRACPGIRNHARHMPHPLHKRDDHGLPPDPAGEHPGSTDASGERAGRIDCVTEDEPERPRKKEPRWSGPPGGRLQEDLLLGRNPLCSDTRWNHLRHELPPSRPSCTEGSDTPSRSA